MRETKNNPVLRFITAAVLAVMILGICLTAASCGGGDPDLPAAMQIVSGEDKNFKLYVPKTWTINSSSGYASAFYSQEDRSNVSLIAYAADESYDPRTYIDEFLEQYTEQFPDTELIDREEDKLGGYDAERIVFTSTVAGVKYKFMQVITLLGDFYYIFTYTSPVDNYDSHMIEVALIVNNIKFK